MSDHDAEQARRLELAGRVTFWRERAGLTKGELAKLCRKTAGAATRWEDGSASPSQASLALICTACGIDMQTFHGPLPEPEPAVDVVDTDTRNAIAG